MGALEVSVANISTRLSEVTWSPDADSLSQSAKIPPVSSDGTIVWGQGLGIQENRIESVLKGCMIQWNLTYFSEKYLS